MNPTLASLVAQAQAQVAQFPQYATAFEGATMVRMLGKVKTKAGIAFTRGEFAIRMREHASGTEGFVTLWSMQNMVATSVPVEKVAISPTDEFNDRVRAEHKVLRAQIMAIRPTWSLAKLEKITCSYGGEGLHDILMACRAMDKLETQFGESPVI